VYLLRAADEAHRGHAVTEPIHCPLGGRPYCRMIGEAQVVVGAEVDDLAIAGAHHRTLWPGEHALALVESLLAKRSKLAPQTLEKGLIHKA